MAEKFVEDLVLEIENLEKKVAKAEKVNAQLVVDLENAKKSNAAIEHIKTLAKEYEVGFNNKETSGEYWKEVLAKVIYTIYDEAKGAVEALEEHISNQDETIAKHEVQTSLQKQRIIELNNQIEQLDKKIAHIEQESTSEINRLKKLVAEREAIKEQLAEVKNLNTKLNKRERKLYRAQTKAELLNLELAEKMLELETEYKAVKDVVKNLTSEEIYAIWAGRVVRKFIDAGYKVSPYSPDKSNNVNNNREYELYKAVKQAKALDKKAEKKAGLKKSKQPGIISSKIYPENGYISILSQLADEYRNEATAFEKAKLLNIIDFENKYAQDMDKDGKVFASEVIETIIDKERSKVGLVGYLKTTQGKVLSLATAFIIASALTFGGIQANEAYKANQEVENQNSIIIDQNTQLEDWEDKYGVVVGEKDQAVADKEQAEAEKDQAIADKEAAEQERDELKDQLGNQEDLKPEFPGQITGNKYVFDTTAEQFVKDFAAAEAYLETRTANDVQKVAHCEYNNAIGDVVIDLLSVEDGQNITTRFTFTIENLSSEIKEGESFLDFATIVQAMQKNPRAVKKQVLTQVVENEKQPEEEKPNDSMSSNQQASRNVSVGFEVSGNEKFANIVCVVKVEIVDEQGNRTVTTHTSDKWTINLKQVSIEVAKQRVQDSFLKELGIELADEEIEME